MTLDFQFSSDTNTQLFMDWLSSREKRFRFDHNTGIVSVPAEDVDAAVHEEMRDLGGTYLGDH